MNAKGTFRAMQAAERRRQRESQRHLRELQHRAKEQAKLSALEQARLEVETYENRLEVLLSVHKEQGETWDWAALFASLPPPCPQRSSHRELKSKQRAAILPPHQKQGLEAAIEQARQQDERAFQEALRSYSEERAEWEKFKDLSRRILAGEHKAYLEALVEINPFAEISELGSSLHFTVHNARSLECVLTVNGAQAIPSDVKTLTTSGKVSIKAMPKARFHELYQDYLCGCVLRAAREVFALLPVETLLVTASAELLDPRTGKMGEQPVLSVVIPREVLSRLDFDRLDPSDAMENFQHRGDFKVSRKSGAFLPITPLTPATIEQSPVEGMAFADFIAHFRRLREELSSMNAELRPRSSAPAMEDSSPL